MEFKTGMRVTVMTVSNQFFGIVANVLAGGIVMRVEKVIVQDGKYASRPGSKFISFGNMVDSCEIWIWPYAH